MLAYTPAKEYLLALISKLEKQKDVAVTKEERESIHQDICMIVKTIGIIYKYHP